MSSLLNWIFRPTETLMSKTREQYLLRQIKELEESELYWMERAQEFEDKYINTTDIFGLTGDKNGNS